MKYKDLPQYKDIRDKYIVKVVSRQDVETTHKQSSTCNMQICQLSSAGM